VVRDIPHRIASWLIWLQEFVPITVWVIFVVSNFSKQDLSASDTKSWPFIILLEVVVDDVYLALVCVVGN